MKLSIEKKVNFLIIYAVVSTLLLSLFVFSSFRKGSEQERIDELTVKRINIIGEDGLVRMVLSNKERQHPGRMNGKELPKRERESGIIFFNEEGDECGGLIHGGKKEKNGKISSGMSFTMDQYHEDQVIQIFNEESYENGNADIERGIKINEYPVGSNLGDRIEKFEAIEKIKDTSLRREELNKLIKQTPIKRRLLMGKINDNTGLFLSDKNGKRKLMIYVNENGEPKIETVNEKGEIKSAFK